MERCSYPAGDERYKPIGCVSIEEAIHQFDNYILLIGRLAEALDHYTSPVLDETNDIVADYINLTRIKSIREEPTVKKRLEGQGRAVDSDSKVCIVHDAGIFELYPGIKLNQISPRIYRTEQPGKVFKSIPTNPTTETQQIDNQEATTSVMHLERAS